MDNKYKPFKDCNEYVEVLIKYIGMQFIRYSEIKEETAKNEYEILHNNVRIRHETNEEYVQSIEIVKEMLNERTLLSLHSGIFLPFYELSQRFSLTPFEKQLLLTALACELDNDLSLRCMNLNQTLKEPFPTVELAINLYRTQNILFFSNDIINSLENKMFVFFFKKETDNISLSTPLKLNVRILKYLINSKSYPFFSPYGYIYKKNEELSFLYTSIDFDIEKAYRTDTDKKRIFMLFGDKGSGKKHYLKDFSNKTNKNIVFINLEIFVDIIKDSFSTTLNKIILETILQNAALCFYNTEKVFANTDSHFWNDLSSRCLFFLNEIFITSETDQNIDTKTNAEIIKVKIKNPNFSQRLLLWEKSLEGIPLQTPNTSEILANKYKFTPGQIKNTVKEIELNLYRIPLSLEEINEHCNNQIVFELKNQAEKITPSFSWEQLILPENIKNQMSDALNHVRYSGLVMEKWGFGERIKYGNGMHMLFTGPPGTGKTMAAQVIANELAMDIYKIDISRLVSKYVGETEKNFDKIFNSAKKSNIILFFDEMDSIFGKRSSASDSNDKYANMETSYLLQKIEEYDGVVIMATNYLNNVDEAFMRRIHFVFHFPLPNKDYRKKLWQSMFPLEAPISEKIDYDYLAEKFEFTGGIIKNIAISAAFMSAAQNCKITMSQIIKAIFMEISKQGKTVIKSDFGKYSFFLDEVYENEP